jgi:hypothetical protein
MILQDHVTTLYDSAVAPCLKWYSSKKYVHSPVLLEPITYSMSYWKKSRLVVWYLGMIVGYSIVSRYESWL